MDILKRAMTLVLVCVLSALVLTMVYSLMSDTIEQVKYDGIMSMKKELVPAAARFDGPMSLDGRWSSDAKTSPDGRAAGERARYDNMETCFDARGIEVGKIVYVTANGHDGDIRLMVGVSSLGDVAGLKVVSSNETPGLGSKISGPEFLSQFIGKNYYSLALKQDSSKGGIDEVKGATVSSRAVVDAVREAISIVTSRENGYSRQNNFSAYGAFSKENEIYKNSGSGSFGMKNGFERRNYLLKRGLR
jgi:electron transport complex protein RnfG